MSSFQPQTKAELQTAIYSWINSNAAALTTYGDINTWDTSLIIDMSRLFQNNYYYSDGTTTPDGNPILDTTSFNDNISSWDISSVTNMRDMFNGAADFNQNISSWNIDNVTLIQSMFIGARAFNQDISSWNTDNVTNMSYMFSWADSFNQDISSWNTSSVSRMNNMFDHATVFNKDISGWNTGIVEYFANMFNTASVFNQNIRRWKPPSTAEFTNMFSNATAMNANYGTVGGSYYTPDYAQSPVYNVFFNTFYPLLKTELQTAVDAWCENTDNTASDAFNTYGDINTWDTSLITYMSNLFKDKSTFNDDISSWDTSAVTTMRAMFAGATIFNQDISTFNTSLVTSMRDMFKGASAFNKTISQHTLDGVVRWDVQNVTDMHFMFGSATNFNNGSATDDSANPLIWNTASLSDVGRMFQGASAFNQDISSWDVTGIGFFWKTFRQATKFNNGGVALGWDVSNAEAFDETLLLTAFNQDISGWNTSNVTSVYQMFYGNTVFNQDISNWNTANITNMQQIFHGASAFDCDGGFIRKWVVQSGANVTNMFNNATAMDAIYQDDSSILTYAYPDYDDTPTIAGFFNQEIADPGHEFEMRNSTGVTSITDSFDENITATLENGAAGSADGMVFDGVDDYVDTTSYTFGGALTVEAYVKFDTIGQWDYARIIHFSDGNTNNEAIQLRQNENRLEWSLSLANGIAANSKIVTTNVLSKDTWFHIVATIAADSNMKLYINNVLWGSGGGTGILPTTMERSNHTIGGRIDNNQLDGTIAYIRVWHGAALPSTEIKSLYNNRDTANYFSSGGGASGDPHVKCLNGTEYDFRYHGYMRLLETSNTIVNAQCAPGMNQQSKMEYFTHAFIKYRGEEAVLKLGWRGEPVVILENSGLDFKEKMLTFNGKAKRHCETCRGWASSNDKKCDEHAEKYEHTVAELVRNALELKIDGATLVFQNVNDHNGQPCGISVQGKPKGASAGLIAGAEWADASELTDLKEDTSLLTMVSKTA